MDEKRTKNRESRAVAAALQGGGFVMFSCTADAADELDNILDTARKERKKLDVAEIVAALNPTERDQ